MGDTLLKTRKGLRRIPRRGLVRIRTTFNNTIICVTTLSGETLFWASAGSCGFKGARKKSPLAAKVAANRVAKAAKAKKMKNVRVVLHGPGRGRQIVIRAIMNAKLKLISIQELSYIAYNGCRPPKQRRV